MRVTQNSMFRTMGRYLQTQTANLARAQEQASSGKRINRLSDNAVGAGKLLNLNNAMSRINQQMKNIDTVQTHTALQDTTLAGITEVLNRAKQLMVQEANEVSSTETSREAVRKETLALTQQLLGHANTQLDGQYIFGGYATGTQPFSPATIFAMPSGSAVIERAVVEDVVQFSDDEFRIQFGTPPTAYNLINATTGETLVVGETYTPGTPVRFMGMEISISSPGAGETIDISTTMQGVYNGDSGVQQVEIEPNLRVALNIPGARLFEGSGITGGVNIFEIMNRVSDAMKTNNRVEIDNLLGDLDKALSQVNTERTGVGARVNLAEASDARQTELLIHLETARGDVEDIDLTEAVLNLTQQQTAYQATLGAAGTISKMSLMDFLR